MNPFKKPLNPANFPPTFHSNEESFNLNDSISFRSFPSLIIQPSSTTTKNKMNLKKNLNPNPVPFIPINFNDVPSHLLFNSSKSNFPNNMNSINQILPTNQTNHFGKSSNENFNKNEKTKFVNSPKNLNISEKPGYNFISVLKEFTDQSRMIMSFDYSPQINSFSCCCYLNKEPKGEGKGNNKQEAKKEASKQTIELILKENPQFIGYFSKFIEIEKDYQLFPENNDMVYINDKEVDSEAIVILNQYCQQHFQTNPNCEYEPCINGYAVIMTCGTYVERAEGASKKIVII